MENAFDNVIHVTGFGVFRGFADTNPSWEAVSRLPEAVEINNKRFAIVKHEVPVTYADVNEKIKDIWTQKPKVKQSSYENAIFSMTNHIIVSCKQFLFNSTVGSSLRSTCKSNKNLSGAKCI